MKDNFFIPWHENFTRGKEYRALAGNTQHSYKYDYFGITTGENVKWWNKPYFAITNERSTVKFFLDAVLDGRDEKEAAVYVSKDSKMKMEDVRKIFSGVRRFEYACKLKEDKLPDFSTVTICTAMDGNGKKPLIHVKMIFEPNRYGRWKIYKIEKSE